MSSKQGLPIRVIINPRSGTHKRRRHVMEALLSAVRSSQGTVEICETAHGGHAELLAREAASSGYDRVLVVGGDGTVNEAVKGLESSQCPLGIIAMGSGNGLARRLRLPLDPRAAVELGLSPSASVRSVDVGCAGPLRFMNALGLGLDAEVAHLFARSQKRGLGPYVLCTVQAWRTRRSFSLELLREGQTFFSGTCLLAAICNSGEYGNGAVIAPHAELSDGRLDLVAIRPSSLGFLLVDALRLFRERIHLSPRVKTLVFDQACLRTITTMPCHADGEPGFFPGFQEITLIPRGLKVLCPNG